MNKTLQLLFLFAILLVLYGQTGFAQENEADASQQVDTEEAAETAEPAAGQEVEINEDNYRQFMELRDARQQRDILPENAFKPKSGSQKLDDLPEASQKHLRNQLREIIVQGDEWQPGDEGDVYSYVPSEAASTDPSLQKQESEAWGELVDSYHEREAESYENGARASAAQGNEGSQGNGGGNSQKPGGEQSGQGEAGEEGQAGEENPTDQRDAADSYSPNGSKDPNAKSTSGVSQNAMEFLNRLAGGGDEAGEAGTGDSDEGTGQQASQAQEMSNQGDSTGQDSPTGGESQDPTDSSSMEGATQNALDYLSQGDAQNEDGDSANTGSGDGGDGQSNGNEDDSENGQELTGQQADENNQSNETSVSATINLSTEDQDEEISTQGTSQNALEYLTGDGVENGDTAGNGHAAGESEGTLSIQDLLNAQGVGDAVGTNPSSDNATGVPDPDPDKDKKDGDG